MAMSNLKQKLLIYELAKAGYPKAEYNPVTDKVYIHPDQRMTSINDEGDIAYGADDGRLAIDILRPLVNSVNESFAAWEQSSALPFEDKKHFRALAEYNNVVLAARDDTARGRGLLFVTWKYNYDKTAFENGFYTENYSEAKESFATRSGLVPSNKLFSHEQATDIRAAIEYRIENDGDMPLTMKDELKTIATKLRYAYSATETQEATDANGLRRYMDIDLGLYLGKISEKVIIFYPNDWNYDLEYLTDIAKSDNPEEKRLIWHVCSYGTHLKVERDVFISDTGPYCYMTDYRQNDLDMFGFYIEVTGINENGAIKGNVFEVGDYAEFAKHIRATAAPLDSLTLVYSDKWGVNAGKAVTVSRKEYDSDRHRLMSESGNVTKLIYHPRNEVHLAAVISNEHSKRMAFPIGSTTELLQRVEHKLAEVRKPLEPPEQSTPKPQQTLADKIQAANEKVKAQDTQSGTSKSSKKEER